MSRYLITLDNFENNLGINHKFIKILNGELCDGLCSTFLLPMFSESSFFQRDINKKVFGRYRHEWLKSFLMYQYILYVSAHADDLPDLN